MADPEVDVNIEAVVGDGADADAGVPAVTMVASVMTATDQDEYWRSVKVLRWLIDKRQQVAIQPMQSRLSSIAAEAASTRECLASLASSQEWQANWEWATVTGKLALLTAEEHDLQSQIGQVTEEIEKTFLQQLVPAL